MSGDRASGSVDAAGKLELHGIDFIPEAHRTRKPGSILWIVTGADVTFPPIIVGTVPIALGLSWWAAFWALVVGTILGCIQIGIMSLLSPRTGTNISVSSAAHFGIKGRLLASIVGFLTSIFFTALAIWAGGDTMVFALHRLVGTTDARWFHALWYIVFAIIAVAVGAYGFATMAKVQKIFAWSSGLILIVAAFLLSPHFSADYAGGKLALGSFWPTWVFAVGVYDTIPLGYVLVVGDWTRYISKERYSTTHLALAAVLAVIVGMGLPMLWGTYTASMMAGMSGGYIANLVNIAPLWFVIFLLWVGIGTGFGHAAVDLYTTGLDMCSVFPTVNRLNASLMAGIMAVIVVVLGTFYGSIINNIITALDLLAVLLASFTGVITVGYFNHRGCYDADALQDVLRKTEGGRYWYLGGWEWRSTLAFLLASVGGILCLKETWFTGPLFVALGGFNAGFILSWIGSGVIYAGLLWAFPEDDVHYAHPDGSLFAHKRYTGKLA